MTILRLDPPIPVEAAFGPDWSRQGQGYAHAWLDYSQEHHLLWLVCEEATREWWIVPQFKVKGCKNQSLAQSAKAPPSQPSLPLKFFDPPQTASAVLSNALQEHRMAFNRFKGTTQCLICGWVDDGKTPKGSCPSPTSQQEPNP